MPNSTQNDYLRYSAISIKDLIRLKLTENGTFTDQNFEDSNLSIFIDTVAYMYSTLIFYLNNGASESIFTDTQLYENMNRIVKLLGYNPQGFITSTVQNSMGLRDTYSFNNSGIKTIPKYTTYTTSLTDANGNPIKYTFVEDYAFVASSISTIDSDFKPILYNGEWKLYNNTFTSTGIPFETFTLENLTLTGTDRIYLSHNHITIIAKLDDGSYEEYKPVTNLYNSTPTDRHFEVRVSEDFKYTLKFGDNINGKRLSSGTVLYVIYLQSNGADGQIGVNVIDGSTPLSVTISGLDEAFIKNNILKVSLNPQYIKFGTDPNAELDKVKLYNEVASTYVKDFETVDSIRQNAPVSFRIGSRLVTEQDYKQYILMNYPSDIYDVTVQNNWAYMVEFHKWLYDYNKLSPDIRFFNYNYTDSCDFNNIYIWVKSYGSEMVTKSTKTLIERDCDRIKTLTSELVFLDPLMVTFTPYIRGNYSLNTFDSNFENKIQLIRDRNTLITVERIKQRAINIIQTFFSNSNNTLGMTIDLNSLYNQLMAIDGVKAVRTKYLQNNQPVSTTQYYDGLSFAMWTQHIINGADFKTISGNYKLKSFQFPILLDSNSISNRIEVSSDSFNINEVEY